MSWALGIAGYEVMTVRKQRARRRETGSDALDRLEQQGADVEERMMAMTSGGRSVALVGELPERDRAALAYAFAGDRPADGRDVA